MNTELLDRATSKFTATDGCWEWNAHTDRYGYGVISVGGTMRRAHRVIYELLVGPIPEGLELDHLCRVRSCVRPDHLAPVTHAENMRRGMWATKTHCIHGHPFDEANTYMQRKPNGGFQRGCRACIARRSRELKARKLALCPDQPEGK